MSISALLRQAAQAPRHTSQRITVPTVVYAHLLDLPISADPFTIQEDHTLPLVFATFVCPLQDVWGSKGDVAEKFTQAVHTLQEEVGPASMRQQPLFLESSEEASYTDRAGVAQSAYQNGEIMFRLSIRGKKEG